MAVAGRYLTGCQVDAVEETHLTYPIHFRFTTDIIYSGSQGPSTRGVIRGRIRFSVDVQRG
jgi:hypothetical protein